MVATYCTFYCYGVSAQHQSATAHPIIVSVIRVHLYFTVMRLLRRMEGGESMAAISREYGAGELYGKVAKTPRE